jgi:cobalt/nickel transport system permease protein
VVALFKYKCHTKHRTSQHKHKIKHKHGEWISIDFYAYASKIRHWNPKFKVYFAVITVILCISLNNPYVSYVVIITMAYITIMEGELPVREYISILMIPTLFILISIFTVVIDISKEPMGQYNLNIGLYYLFTSEARINVGIFLLLKIFAAISVLQMMTLSTPSSEIIYVLRKAHMPKLIVELMNMIYRYIFILLDVAAKMKNSALCRQGYCDLKTSCYTFGRISSNMLIISLKKANAYYDAMEARCYEGELVFFEEYERVDGRKVILATVFVIFLIVVYSFNK